MSTMSYSMEEQMNRYRPITTDYYFVLCLIDISSLCLNTLLNEIGTVIFYIYLIGYIGDILLGLQVFRINQNREAWKVER